MITLDGRICCGLDRFRSDRIHRIRDHYQDPADATYSAYVRVQRDIWDNVDRGTNFSWIARE